MEKDIITVSIVTYKNNADEIETVLRCCDRCVIDMVFVIDNSPEDSLRSLVAQISRTEYFWGHGNIGYGAAHNIAIRKAIENGSQYHVVLNPDIYFENGTIKALTNFMNQNKNAGQIMPKIVSPDGELQYLCKLLPTPMDLIGRRFIPVKSYIDRRNQKFELRSSSYDKIIEVPFLSGCFMFFRVETLQKVNGFDDRYFMYCEDIDICRRIAMSGYQTIYYPFATVVHVHKKDSFKSSKMLRVHMKSAFKYFNRWGWIFDTYRKTINKKTLDQIT